MSAGGKYLVSGNLFLHMPWMEIIRRWCHAKDEVDGLIFTGNLCSMMLPREKGDFQNALLKEWCRNLPTKIFWAVGECDPADIEEWPDEIPNLHLAGNYVEHGWQISVLSHHQHAGLVVPVSNLPTLLASHYPPTDTRVSLSHGGEAVGKHHINAAIKHAGNVRLAVCGHAMDPLDHVDAINGTVVACHGNAIHEVGPQADAPTFLSVDLSRRSFTLFDGRHTKVCDFAR